MKKYILIFSLILLSCSVIYSQSNTEIDKRLQKFYKQFAHDNMTEVELTEKYGEPNSIERKKTGYLNNEWLLNERRSGCQGCPITYPSQYWQILPVTKTNCSVDGYFCINRNLYDYY